MNEPYSISGKTLSQFELWIDMVKLIFVNYDKLTKRVLKLLNKIGYKFVWLMGTCFIWFLDWSTHQLRNKKLISVYLISTTNVFFSLSTYSFLQLNEVLILSNCAANSVRKCPSYCFPPDFWNRKHLKNSDVQLSRHPPPTTTCQLSVNKSFQLVPAPQSQTRKQQYPILGQTPAASWISRKYY